MKNGILYIVGTPIGNLSDLSERVGETLRQVDFIAAEDTRVTQKLLFHLDIYKPMVSYYEHNRRARGEEIVARLGMGESCALVTDAGMPVISDPGEDLVQLCAEHSIPVYVIPGPCAAVCALAASGLPGGRWCFEGFLSTAKKSRFEHLEALKAETRTMIFYEAPHKLCATLRDLCTTFGEKRRISLSREMTKLHEETLRMTLGEAVKYFEETAPRGEFVLILEGAPRAEVDMDAAMELALEEVKERIRSGETSKDAVKFASAAHGVRKNALYQRVLEEQEK